MRQSLEQGSLQYQPLVQAVPSQVSHAEECWGNLSQGHEGKCLVCTPLMNAARSQVTGAGLLDGFQCFDPSLKKATTAIPIMNSEIPFCNHWGGRRLGRCVIIPGVWAHTSKQTNLWFCLLPLLLLILLFPSPFPSLPLHFISSSFFFFFFLDQNWLLH